jgi:hypothetical protein
LFINRPDQGYVGLFGFVDIVDQEGIQDIGLVNIIVTGHSDVGGLVGYNDYGNVSNSYSTGNVTGDLHVGGLVGQNLGYVHNSFWDMQTSGQTTSSGGTGKNTTEMKSLATFSGAGWNIIEVAPGSTNTTYIWNIVNVVTYPFLSWQ